jgi:hypothetical protein
MNGSVILDMEAESYLATIDILLDTVIASQRLEPMYPTLTRRLAALARLARSLNATSKHDTRDKPKPMKCKLTQAQLVLTNR